jgi:hypothetical protein
MLFFLILFSYTILFEYFPLNIYGEDRSHISRLPIPITEIFVHIFLISIGIEEIRQVLNLSEFKILFNLFRLFYMLN